MSGASGSNPLDQLLCQARALTLPNGRTHNVRRTKGEAWQNDTTRTDLQVVWPVYTDFKTEAHMSQVYGFNGLTGMMWSGDHRMLDFLAQWDFILGHLEGDTPDPTCQRR